MEEWNINSSQCFKWLTPFTTSSVYWGLAGTYSPSWSSIFHLFDASYNGPPLHKTHEIKNSLVPCLFTPVFVTCSIDVVKDLVKLITWSDIPGCRMCGEVAHSFYIATEQLSESEKYCQGCSMSTTQLLLGQWL